MKNLVFLTFSLNLFSCFCQVRGVEDYTLWSDDNSIAKGVKGYIYPTSDPYHKLYWYAERCSKEGFEKVVQEIERILKLNGSNLKRIDEILDEKDNIVQEDALEELFMSIERSGTGHYYVHWMLKDKHRLVVTGWVVELYIDPFSVQLYINSTYIRERIAHQEYINSIR